MAYGKGKAKRNYSRPAGRSFKRSGYTVRGRKPAARRVAARPQVIRIEMVHKTQVDPANPIAVPGTVVKPSPGRAKL